MGLFNFLKHTHIWSDDGLYKRNCKCGEHQILVENCYPDIGVPRYEWVSLTKGDQAAARLQKRFLKHRKNMFPAN